MRKLFLTIAVLLMGAYSCMAAGNYNDLWQKGDAFYSQKQYDSAAACFEQIAALKPRNAAVYFNLGNAYYRLNRVAPAVLNYERALKINPDYTEARENLALAQGRISNAIPPTGNIFFVAWWHSLTRPDRATTWAIVALSIFTLVCLLMLVRRLQKSARGLIPSQLTGFLFFAFLCFLALAFFASSNVAPHTAVVMQADTPLMKPDLKGKPIILVPEGTTVKIESENGLWAEVTLPDGRSGWLQETLIDKI